MWEAWGGVVFKALHLIVGRTRNRLPVVSLGIFSVATDGTMCPGDDSASKMSTKDFSWGKGGRCVRLTTYHPRSAERQGNPGP
jgi:hypothetical protein